MNIKIIADSTCDLSPALVEKYNIAIMPLTVIKDGKEYSDGITITPADIFAHVANGGDLCSTAAVNIDQYATMFEKYAAEYDGVVHINISSDFSCCYQNACIAAADFSNVRVIDSRNLSTGQGLVVLKACELAENCEDLDVLKAALDAYTAKVEASFVVEDLKYLVKGGRCSSVAALGANLLRLKPCIEVRDGKMVTGKKYRGSFEKCLANYVTDRLEGREDLEGGTLFITHTPVSESALSEVKNALEKYPLFQNTYETEAGCTVSCHCGPGTLGILIVRK